MNFTNIFKRIDFAWLWADCDFDDIETKTFYLTYSLV